MRCKSIASQEKIWANRCSGGGNGMSAFPSAVHFDVPVVDGDAMGRAYPTMYHGMSPNILPPILFTNLCSHIQCLRSLSDTMRSLRRKRQCQRSNGKPPVTTRSGPY